MYRLPSYAVGNWKIAQSTDVFICPPHPTWIGAYIRLKSPTPLNISVDPIALLAIKRISFTVIGFVASPPANTIFSTIIHVDTLADIAPFVDCGKNSIRVTALLLRVQIVPYGLAELFNPIHATL